MEQKVILVTGGSGGIGYEIIKKLVANDYFVVFTYASQAAKAKEIETEFPQKVKAVQYKASTNYEDVENILQFIKEEYGKIDGLVNNLGQTNDKLLIKMSTEDFLEVINSNLTTAFNFSKAALKIMSRQRFGKIINMSSVVGLSGNIGQTNYSASKAGMYGLTKSLSKEYAKKGITVNSISPGFIKTKMTDELSDSIKETLLSHIPMQRFGEPSEVAGVVKFLLSDDANYITGQNIIIDGGLI